MSRDIEYLTSNRRIRFPFSDDLVLPISEQRSHLVFGCFVDALIQIKEPNSDTVPYITGISISGHTLNFSIVGNQERGEETVQLNCTRSMVRFPVVSGESSWCWYVFVMSSDGIHEYEEAENVYSEPVSSALLPLNKRCLGYPSESVSSLWIYGGELKNKEGKRLTRAEALLRKPDVIVSDDVSFKPGYNMQFDEEDNGFSLNARAGYGLGVAPCGCDSSTVKFKTPGLLSPDGHARFMNDTCYDLVPSKYTDQNGVLIAHAKCKACCTCEMYASIVNNRLIPLRDEIKASKAIITNALSTYETNVKKWNERIATALPDDIAITSTGVSLDPASTDLRRSASVAGKMSRCGFSIMVRNDSFVNVSVTLDKFSSNGKPFEAQLSYMRTATDPEVLPLNLEQESGAENPIFNVTLSPGRSAVLTYFIRLGSLVKTGSKKGFLARAQVSVYHNDKLVVRRYEEMGI